MAEARDDIRMILDRGLPERLTLRSPKFKKPPKGKVGLRAGKLKLDQKLLSSLNSRTVPKIRPQRTPVSDGTNERGTSDSQRGISGPGFPPQATHYSFDNDVITAGRLGIPEVAGPKWDRNLWGQLANAVTKLVPPGKYPSYELRGRDPKTKDPREAVSVWLGDHASEIKSVAAKRGIDPTAIAGAIAWEALENPYRPDTPPWRRDAGPGKVHPPIDWAASLLAHPTDSEYEIRRNWALRTEVEGYMPPLNDEQRRKKLVTDSGAIQYIGAILGLIAQMAEDKGYLIRAQPGILDWAFHGSDPEKWSNLLSAKRQGAKFELPSDMMGGWVEYNQQYLKAALNRQ